MPFPYWWRTVAGWSPGGAAGGWALSQMVRPAPPAERSPWTLSSVRAAETRRDPSSAQPTGTIRNLVRCNICLHIKSALTECDQRPQLSGAHGQSLLCRRQRRAKDHRLHTRETLSGTFFGRCDQCVQLSGANGCSLLCGRQRRVESHRLHIRATRSGSWRYATFDLALFAARFHVSSHNVYLFTMPAGR